MKPLTQPMKIYQRNSEGGALIEGRRDRKGGSTMEIGSLTKLQEVSSVTWTTEKHDYIKRPCLTMNYTVRIKSYFPFSILVKGDSPQHLLYNSQRFDSYSNWKLSFNEVLRHLGRMENDIGPSKFYALLKKYAGVFKDQIIDALQEYLDNIHDYGLYSLEQWTLYVRDHAGSVSPFKDENDKGIMWHVVLGSPAMLRYTWVQVNNWIFQFIEDFKTIIKTYVTPMVKAGKTYPANRHRDGEATVIDKNEWEAILRIVMWLSRKAGGIEGLSQIEYPIWERKAAKRKCYEPLMKLCKLILGTQNVHSITMEGAKFYESLLKNKVFAYDISNSEKQVGNVFNYLPFSVDLGHPEYSQEYVWEMYSGIGPTRILNELLVCLILLICREVYGTKFSIVYLGGDNFATDVDLSFIEQKSFGVEERILGYHPMLRRFWPLSWMTDNPKHRSKLPLTWRNVKWIQSYQYKVRPLQTVVQNDIYRRGSCFKFIKWISENIENHDMDIYGKDSFNEKIYEDENLREKFLDKFVDELHFVENFIPTTNNPLDTSDMRVFIT